MSIKAFDINYLAERGLNLCAIINLNELPQTVKQSVAGCTDQFEKYTQLILLGHGGKTLWKKFNQSKLTGEDPLDDYSSNLVSQVFIHQYSAIEYQLIYPGEAMLNLQRLGEIAGWHSPSPLALGINQQWGSWFAYRALVLANSQFETSKILEPGSPCTPCETKPCISSCPAGAVTAAPFKLDQCINYRKQSDSLCRDRCLARMACPVGEQHQYSVQQIQYHYLLSLQTIVKSS